MKRVGLIARLLSVAVLSVAILGVEGCAQNAAMTHNKNMSMTKRWSRSNLVSTEKQWLRLKPVLSGNTLYTADARGNVHAVDAQTGRDRWVNRTHTPIRTGVAVGSGGVFVGTAYGDLLSLAQTSGHLDWFQTYNAGLLATPLVTRGIVVDQALNGQVTAYRASNGHLLWNQQSPNPDLVLRVSGAAAPAGADVILPMSDGQAVKASLQSGLPAWRRAVATAKGTTAIERLVDLAVTPVVVGSRTYVSGYQGVIAALSTADGHVIWSHPFSSFTGIDVDSSAVYATDISGELWSFDRMNGHVLWHQPALKHKWAGSPAVQKSLVWVGDEDGYLSGFSTRTGRLMLRTRVASAPIVAAPVVQGNNLYAGATNGRLVSYYVTQ